MTRRVGRNVSWVFRGKASLIGGLCALSLAVLFPAGASAASCSTDEFGNAVCGVDITVAAGQLFAGQVGTYTATEQWAVSQTQIAWGDGTTSAGSDSGGETTGSHVYIAGGTYTVTIITNFDCTAADALCSDRAGQPSAAQASGTATAAVAPVFTSVGGATFQVGKLGTFRIRTTGTPPAGLSLSGALPAGVTFTDNRDGTATLSGTPESGTGGSYALALTAANGLAPDATQSFRLLVQAPPVAVIASPASGGDYPRGASIQTSFACREGAGGSGLASCADSTGTVTASGGAGRLDTSSLGAHAYTVTATSRDGLTSATTVRYAVVAPEAPSLLPQAPPRLRLRLSLAPPLELVHGSVRVRLACSGGAAGSRCEGRVWLAARIRYVTYTHRQLVSRVRRLVVAGGGYAAASGGQDIVTLRLSPLALRLLAQAPADRLALHASATVAGGATSHRTLTLHMTPPGS